MNRTQIAAAFALFTLGFTLMSGAGPESSEHYQNKLRNITIPEIELKNVTPAGAVDAIRSLARECDPEEEGIKIGIEAAFRGEAEKRVSLSMKGVTLGQILDELGKQLDRSVELYPEGILMRRVARLKEEGGMPVRHFAAPSDIFHRCGGAAGDPFQDPFDSDTPPPRFEVVSAKHLFEEHGVSFPEGAAAEFDRVKGILTVRNTAENLETIGNILDTMMWHKPHQIRVSAEVYALSSADALRVSRAAENGVLGGALDLVESLLHDGDAKIGAAPAIMARSGQRVKVDAGWDLEIKSGVEVVDGKETVATEVVHIGCRFELESVIGLDGVSVDVDLALDLNHGKPKIRKAAGPGGEKAPLEMVESASSHLDTAITILSGQTQFVGIIPAGGEVKEAHAVFIRASVVPVSYEPLRPR